MIIASGYIIQDYMKRRIMIICLAIVLIFSGTSFGLTENTQKSRSFLLGDYETGEILEYFNIDEPIEMASITKLLSYYVIMDEIYKGTIGLEDKITIGKDVEMVKGSSYKLKEGEIFTVEKLLKACIIVSGNDATYAIAKHIAGSEANFVKLMQRKAANLGLSNASIYNSSGLPINNEGLQNKMTTREIFILTRSLLKDYPQVTDISKIPFISEPNRDFFELNTNPLLKIVEGVDGLKTGFTGKAGYCFVSTFNIPGERGYSENLRLIGISMGSRNYEDRTYVSKYLVQYAKDNYIKREYLNSDRAIDSVIIRKGLPQEIDIYPEEGFSLLSKQITDISYKIELKELEAPIPENTNLGTISVIENGEVLYKGNLVNKEKVEKQNLIAAFLTFYGSLLNRVKTVFSGNLAVS